jgi:hypothetical protein
VSLQLLTCELFAGTSAVQGYCGTATKFVQSMRKKGVSVVVVDKDCKLLPVTSDDSIKEIMSRNGADPQEKRKYEHLRRQKSSH